MDLPIFSLGQEGTIFARRAFSARCRYTTQMTDNELLDRITADPAILGGKPTIRGTRLSVHFILGLLAHGASVDELLAEYQHLAREDIQACLLFASRSIGDTSFQPLPSGAA